MVVMDTTSLYQRHCTVTKISVIAEVDLGPKTIWLGLVKRRHHTFLSAPVVLTVTTRCRLTTKCNYASKIKSLNTNFINFILYEINSW